ncbi:PP2C-domain-containing protein [Rhizopogon salebrosus TDB-379]|nr:PP2C-domain-containing protein [Rhizopogon salebrosus TDB-379]
MSPMGLIHDEIDTSRAFGYYHDLPVVNARPDVHVRQLTELDEFVIIGNHGLWKHISYQTAVDIARSEASDPMIAAQKLRDFAISYDADGNTMLMVMCVADLDRAVDFGIHEGSRSLQLYQEEEEGGYR